MKSKKINENDFNFIERHLADELPPSEELLYEKKFREDAEFREMAEASAEVEVLWRKAMMREALIEELGKLEEANRGKTIRFFPQFLRSNMQWAAAAGILLLIGLFALFFAHNGNQKDQPLADESNKVQSPVEYPDAQYSKGNYYTSGQGMTATAVLLQPDDSVVVSFFEQPSFRWCLRVDTLCHFVIMEKSGNRIIFNQLVTPFEYLLKLDSIKLPPGTYIWYIGERSACRQFTVK